MPAAANRALLLSLTPTSGAQPPLTAALAPFAPGARPPLDSVDDHALVAEMIGARAAAAVAGLPVRDLLDAGETDLVRLGLAPAARRRLLAGAELARRFQPAAKSGCCCRAPHDFLAHLGDLRAAAVEALAVLSLNGRLEVVGGPTVVAGGALMHVAVTPREVFGPAIEQRAAAVVIAHNHPSGAPAPSQEDVTFTRHMARAGSVLGIQVLDHLVVTRRAYFSFAEAGIMSPTRR